jgi:hypothetical protein
MFNTGHGTHTACTIFYLTYSPRNPPLHPPVGPTPKLCRINGLPHEILAELQRKYEANTTASLIYIQCHAEVT